MSCFDMLGAREGFLNPREAASAGDSWAAVAATLAGGAAGALVWRRHPVLGLLNGFALGGNTARVLTGEIPIRRAAENLGAHAIATAVSLGLPSHPAIGYVAGAASANIFLRWMRAGWSLGAPPSPPGVTRPHSGARTSIGVEAARDVTPRRALSPAELAAVDRMLTPEEQRVVSDYQARQADEALAAERGKSEKKSEEKKPVAIVKVDPRPRSVETARTGRRAGAILLGRPAWQTILAGVGILVAGAGIVLAAAD